MFAFAQERNISPLAAFPHSGPPAALRFVDIVASQLETWRQKLARKKGELGTKFQNGAEMTDISVENFGLKDSLCVKN